MRLARITCAVVVLVSATSVAAGKRGEDVDALVRGLRTCEPKGLCEFRYFAAIADAGPETTLVLVDLARRAPWAQRFNMVQLMKRAVDARAVPFLSESLASSDWRVVVAAEHALGALGGAARTARPPLIAVERSHWMARARECAAAARLRIESNDPARRPTGVGCPGDQIPPIERQCLNESRPREEGWRSEFDVESKPPDDAWLKARHPSKTREGALSGGRVSILRRSSAARWTATPAFELPAAPIGFRVLEGGRIAIATEDGTVVLGHGGRLERFDCRPPSPVAPTPAPP